MLKVAVSLSDSMDLRVILSVLYIITETIRAEKENDSADYKAVVDSFTNDLSKCIEECAVCFSGYKGKVPILMI